MVVKTHVVDDYMIDMAGHILLDAIIEGLLIFNIETNRPPGERYTVYRIKCLDIRDEVCRFEL